MDIEAAEEEKKQDAHRAPRVAFPRAETCSTPRETPRAATTTTTPNDAPRLHSSSAAADVVVQEDKGARASRIARQMALDYHSASSDFTLVTGSGPGKVTVVPTKRLASQSDLSLAYSPGVGRPHGARPGSSCSPHRAVRTHSQLLNPTTLDITFHTVYSTHENNMNSSMKYKVLYIARY